MAAAESCEDVVCRDGAVCVKGRCQCDETSKDCDDDPVCTTDDGSCDVRWSLTGQLQTWT